LFVTHPPVGERVRRLRELDPSEREAAENEAAA
jgi:Zn-dependent protease with chaperone function